MHFRVVLDAALNSQGVAKYMPVNRHHHIVPARQMWDADLLDSEQFPGLV
jgi:hypothetical protein